MGQGVSGLTAGCVLGCALLAGCGGTEERATPPAPSPTMTSTVSAEPTTSSTPATPPDTASPTSSQADQAAVAAAFTTYRAALLDSDGAAALPVIHPSVFPLYDESRRLALSGSEAEIRRLGPAGQLNVYVMRATMTRDALRSSSPAQIVRLAIDKGLVGEQGTAALTLGDVEVTGDTAYADVLARGRPGPFKFVFRRHGGAWKLDLKALIELSEPALVALAQRRGLTTRQFVDEVLVIRFGKARAAALHRPLE